MARGRAKGFLYAIIIGFLISLIIWVVNAVYIGFGYDNKIPVMDSLSRYFVLLFGQGERGIPQSMFIWAFILICISLVWNPVGKRFFSYAKCPSCGTLYTLSRNNRCPNCGSDIYQKY